MNAKEAKQNLSLPDLLEKLGYQPEQGGVKRGGNEIWYTSPFNKNERTPSFHVSRGAQIAWIFKCFSSGHKGSIIDFVIACDSCPANDVKTALAYLRSQFPGALFDHQQKKSSGSKCIRPIAKQYPSDNISGKLYAADRQLEYLNDLPLKSGKMLDYLEKERAIPWSISQKYLRLVQYHNKKMGKSFYALGMRNRAGGFEIRSGSSKYTFKSVLKVREITLIKGRNTKEVFLFEGMIDFLSFATLFDDVLPGDCLVMHSVNSFVATKAFIQECDYQKVFLLLDNDATGQKYAERFEKELPIPVYTLSPQFAPYKDFNEAHVKGHNFAPFVTQCVPSFDEPERIVLNKEFRLSH